MLHRGSPDCSAIKAQSVTDRPLNVHFVKNDRSSFQRYDYIGDVSPFAFSVTYPRALFGYLRLRRRRETARGFRDAAKGRREKGKWRASTNVPFKTFFIRYLEFVIYSHEKISTVQLLIYY